MATETNVIKWLKSFGEKPPDIKKPTSEEALTGLMQIASDGVIEDVWDAMDQLPEQLLSQIEQLIQEDRLGEYPRHSAILWHAYTLSNRGQGIATFLQPILEDSIHWAFTFEVNNVLIGGALGALDGLAEKDRERMALSVFHRLGDTNARKYWLLLKVRTDAMLDAVAKSFERLPEDRSKMVGAFRQFDPNDLPLLKKYHQPDNPNFEFFEIAIHVAEAKKMDKPTPIIAG